MKLSNNMVFSSQWKSHNVKIEVNGGFLMAFYIKFFFKTWFNSGLRDVVSNITVDFNKDLKTRKIDKGVFKYQRQQNHETVQTSIHQLSFFRALIRSIYKTINKNANVIGLSELYMLIIRTSIIEPIEYLNLKNGWRLVHAGAFMLNNKTYLISAGSKVGKSTLISHLKKEHNCQVLSDNYCFIKDNFVRTVEEPLRYGPVSRWKIGFYGRAVTGYPDSFESTIDCIIYLRRGSRNRLSNSNLESQSCNFNTINNTEEEGIFFVDEEDILHMDKEKINLIGDFSIKELEIAEGLENVEKAINLIKENEGL